jgi:enoyl-CoA hydratase/carnithine racemase
MLDVSRRGRIGVVSLNRPERRNAMDRELVTALVGAVRRIARATLERFGNR